MGKKAKNTLDSIIYSQEFGATINQVDPFKGRPKTKTGKDKTVDGVNVSKVWDKQQRELNKLTTEERKLVEDTFKKQRGFFQKYFKILRGQINTQLEENMDTNSEGYKKVKSIFDKIFDAKAIEIYFPLSREGDYKVIYQLKESQVPEGRDPLVVEMVSTKEAAKNRVAELQRDENVLNREGNRPEFKSANDSIQYFKNNPPSASFVGQIMDTIEKSNIADSNIKDGIKDDITQLFINTLPETSFAKSLQRREGYKGYDTDSFHAFNKKGYSLARQVVKLEYSSKLRKLSNNLEKKQKELVVTEPTKPKGKTWYERIRNDRTPSAARVGKSLRQRINFAVKGADYPAIEKWAKNVNQVAFIYTLGLNVSSTVVNLSQIPLFAYPNLGAEYGYSRAAKEISKASTWVMSLKNWNQLDSYYDTDYNVKDREGKKDFTPKQKEALEKMRPLIKLAAERGQLTKSFIVDALGLDEMGFLPKGQNLVDWISEAPLDKLAGISAIPFNQAEKFNRQVILLATYNLALEKTNLKGKKIYTPEQAAERALKQTQELNGGAVLETAAPIAQQHIGRVALMYKSYGMRMYTTMLRSSLDYLDNLFIAPEGETTDQRKERKELRRIARNQLIGVHASATFFAGIHGWPIYGMIEMMYNLIFKEDDEEDFDSIARKHFGEIAYKGPVNAMFGADVAARIRLTGLLFQENRFNRDASLEENIFHYAGGPAWSTFNKIKRGVDDIREGTHVLRGFEGLLPAAFSNALKASTRLRTEGYRTRRGDVLYDDLSPGDVAGVILGFSPVEYTNRSEVNNMARRIDQKVNQKRSTILRKYYYVLRQGDRVGKTKISREILEFNRKHPQARITTDSISRSMNRHIKQSENIKTHNGVYISPQNSKWIQDFTRDFETDYTFFDLKSGYPKVATREGESDRYVPAFHLYHTILQTRTPNFSFSTRTCVFICQFLRFATSFTCSTANVTFIHKINTEELVTISSQFTMIRTPSGFKSSVLSIPCLILIFY